MSNERAVVVTRRAEAEILAAYEWLWQRNADYADSWLDGIESAIERLGENPEQYGFAPEAGRYPAKLRQMLYGSSKNYRVLFCIRSTCVTVMSVRHAAQAPLTDVD